MIYMSHVVEHFLDLEGSLTRCFELLRPRGRLVLVYPNRDSLTARYYKQYSVGIWDPPRHVVLAPRKAMTRLLSQVGFKRVRSRTTAWSAASYRAIARQCMTRGEPLEWENPWENPWWNKTLDSSDQHFRRWEALLVALRASVGEEIRITAYKS
jgi:hypothetical protein